MCAAVYLLTFVVWVIFINFSSIPSLSIHLLISSVSFLSLNKLPGICSALSVLDF